MIGRIWRTKPSMPWICRPGRIGGNPAGSRSGRYDDGCRDAGASGPKRGRVIGTEAPDQKSKMHLKGIEEVVTDKGYHSGAVLVEMKSAEVDPTCRRRSRRANGTGKANRGAASGLCKPAADEPSLWQATAPEERRADRAELCALLRYGWDEKDASAGHQNILKRLLIHVGAFNLSLIPQSVGSGTPRELRNRRSSFVLVLFWLLDRPATAAHRPSSLFHRHDSTVVKITAISDTNSVT